MIAPTVSLVGEATPMALIFTRKIRDACENPQYLADVRKLEATFGIRALDGNQRITIHSEQNSIEITSGLSNNCQIVLTLGAKPTLLPAIQGLFRHPMLAMKLGKFLEFPKVNWTDALKRFWEQNQHKPGMPSGMTVKCVDEDRQLSVGGADNACYFEGRSTALAEAFNGESPFIQFLALGKIKGHYNYAQAVILSEATLHMMLGES